MGVHMGFSRAGHGDTEFPSFLQNTGFGEMQDFVQRGHSDLRDTGAQAGLMSGASPWERSWGHWDQWRRQLTLGASLRQTHRDHGDPEDSGGHWTTVEAQTRGFLGKGRGEGGG